MKTRFKNLFRVAFRVPQNIGRFASLAIKAPYSLPEKLHIFWVLLSLWVKAFMLGGRSEKCSQKIFGFRVFGTNFSTLANLFEEIFISRLYHFSSGFAAPTIIDCGANIGFAVFYFKWIYPEAKVIAYEPDPVAFELLRKNVLENKLTNVTIHNKALSDINSFINFYTSAVPGGLHGSLVAGAGSENKAIKVPSVKFSDVVKSCNQINLIKIDVEGAEKMLIKDLAEYGLLTKPELYLIEYHHEIKDNSAKITAFKNYFINYFSCEVIHTSPVYKGRQDYVFRFRKNSSAN